MGLEQIMEKINAATYDPLLATIVSYGVISMQKESHPNPSLDWGILFITAGIIVTKNLFDYYRIREHVREHGWTPEIFKSAYRGKARLFAESHGMLPQYKAAKEEYNESFSW